MKKPVWILCLLLVASYAGAQDSKPEKDSIPGIEAPASATKDQYELARYLCEGIMIDEQKAFILFNWVTHNISLDVDANRDPEQQDPTIREILRSKKTVVNGYIKLYLALCHAAGLDAVDIVGYGRRWEYDDGDELYIPRSGWCAVLINGTWEFIDPASGAGYVTHQPKWLREQLNKFTKKDVRYVKRGEFEQEYDASQFKFNPVTMRSKRIAADPLWQMVRNPMPLSIFRQGDSAVVSYILVNNKRLKNTADLLRVAGYNAAKRTAERAERTHNYNPNFWLDLGAKEQYEASLLLAKYTRKGNIQVNSTTRKAIEKAQQKLDKAMEYVDSQKSYVSPHYAQLKRKNSDKSIEAKRRFRDLRSETNQIVSRLESLTGKLNGKGDGMEEQKKKNDKILDTLTDAKIDEVKTISRPKPSDDPLVVNITDSIDNREERLRALQKEEETILLSMAAMADEEDKYVKRLAQRLPIADSLLRLEQSYREVLKDSYDKEVAQLVDAHDLVWKHGVTHQQKAYLENIENMVKTYSELRINYKQQMLLYRSILKGMELYKRLAAENGDVGDLYTSTVQRYRNTVQKFNDRIEAQAQYYASSVEGFELMKKAYEEDLELLEKMEEVEVQRKEIENTILEDRRSYDEKELDMLTNNLEAQKDDLKKILDEFE